MAKGTPDLKYVKEHDFSKYDGPVLLLNRTDFHYYPTGEIYDDLTTNIEFNRLFEIRQTGFSHASLQNACQEQSRGLHSFVTGGMADITLYKNRFSEHERKLGIAAGLYHDIAITPLSDQGKLIMDGNYEEETLVEYLINKSPEMQDALKKHEIGIDEIVDTIQGKGKVGKLINSREGIDIDNISYLSIDQLWMGMRSGYDERISLREEQGIFDQYNNLKYLDDEWVFDNPELLTKLIKFRALMYKEVYNNPNHRAKEAFLKRILHKENIEMDTLISWNDGDFINWFRDKFGESKVRNFFYIGREDFVEVGKEYDISKMEELKKEKETNGTIVEYMKPPRNAVKNLVLHDKKIKQLEDIPELEEEIENIKEIIKEINHIGIYEQIDE